MSKKTHIESNLNEDRLFPPPSGFQSHQGFGDEQALNRLRREAQASPETFWSDLAREEISWNTPFTTGLDRSKAPHYAWFTDGKLNMSYNCLDRHLETRGEETAIIFEGEPGDIRKISYTELTQEVCRFANALKALGVECGDRVVIYMPMVPEAVIAMQACARIGAIHSVVFGGFSAASLRDRIEDAAAKMVITADGGHRGGGIVALKQASDQALESGCESIEHVVVLKRTGQPVNMVSGRDIWWSDAVADQDDFCEPTWVDAEHPLFLLYTSGSTGKPKGIQHSTAGYLLGSMMTLKWVFDLHDSDIFWCTADVGWITGHTYVTYGPLALGQTIVIYEGAPTVPHGGRLWEICEKHGVTIFYTAPTAIRALMKLGEKFPAQHDLSALRLLGTVGECINPEAWVWYHHHIGKERCPIVDTWWQTETGSIMISPVPGAMSTKPGSCTLPLPGIQADIVDSDGNAITTPNQGGFLVIREPWPSMVRTIWGDPERYYENYWALFDGKYYVAGDSARRDEDGYFWIMGRIDDVLNVAGHRLGTMEIESALAAHPQVVEAAVVGVPDEIKGEAVFAFVTTQGECPVGQDADELTVTLRDWVAEQIGPIAKPAQIRYANGLPKTRSGKIMRRLLRAIASGEEITQDTSTLEDESILDQLQA
jgi:acetyl-CoA synthetase